MYKLFKLNSSQIIKGFSFTVLTLLISTFSINASAKDGVIPLEQLVCYGQATGFSLSPSGEYVASMVPVDENVCDIKDLTDQELAQSRRVLVVTNIETKESKVLSGTSATTSVQSFRWLNDNQLLLTRDGRAEIDSLSYYIIDKDGKNTELLLEAKTWRRYEENLEGSVLILEAQIWSLCKDNS
mgnify:CR=1 FL=1